MRNKVDDPYAVAGLELGLRVIELLLDRDRVGIGDVVRELGASRSAAFRCLRTLELQGFVVLSSSGRGYVAGRILFDFGSIRGIDRETRFRHRPVLQDVREATGESVHSAMLVGEQVLVVDGRRSAFEHDIGLRIGMTAPAHSMAAGKLLLAACDDEQVNAIVPPDPLPQRALATIRTRAALQQELDGIRHSGMALTLQESESGLNSVAVPLDGDSWRNRTALVVSVPLERGAVAQLRMLAAVAATTVDGHRSRGAVSPWRFTSRLPERTLSRRLATQDGKVQNQRTNDR